MALNATRLQQIKQAWSSLVKPVVRAYLIRESRHDRWGPFPVPTTHVVDVYDDEEVAINNLDGVIEVPYLEQDTENQIGTDADGNSIYGTKKMRGATWRRFGVFVNWLESTGRIDAAEKLIIQLFFRRVRVVYINSMDARRAGHEDRYGWEIKLRLKARDDDKRYCKVVQIWANRPDDQDDDIDGMDEDLV